MDFPICPACKQSVIDDDAAECPFCGASMKAKPGAAPPAAAKASTSAGATTAKPSSAAPKPVIGGVGGVKAPPGKKPGPADDFPFELELTVGKAAIQALPNPTKQRQLKVVCPMCDTAGYLPANAAGQDVRCSNPKCVMPVFTAPAPKKAEAPPPPPPKKPSNLPFLAGSTLLLGLVVGGGLYFVNSLPSGSKTGIKEMSEEEKKLMAEAISGPRKKAAGPATKKDAAQDKKDAAAAPESSETPAIDKQALIKSALKQMKESSLEKAQRSKAYCRQLAAESCAVTGDFAGMREHLDQLMKVNNQVTYYRITPLLEQFWVESAAGDKKGAANSLETAMSEVPQIPKFGRTRLELAGRLAAALISAGRTPDALSLLNDFQASDADAQLAARLQIAGDGRVAPLSDRFNVLPWKYPQAVAVTGSLINRGMLELAEKWAASQTSDDAKAECLGLWAEEIARQKAAAGAADAGGVIEAAVSGLPPALAARVWARAGCGRVSAKDEAGALAAIKLAQAKLNEVPKAPESKMPPVKSLIDFKVPPLDPLLRAATAAGEIANLQAQFSATKADAENSLDLALSFAAATAPSLGIAQQKQDEKDRLGSAGLQKMLKDELKKKNDDEARTAANNYRNSLKSIYEASHRRFDLETQLLSRLRGAGLGLDSKVWIVVNSRTNSEDINVREDFFATGLPGELREGLRGTDEEKALLGAWTVSHKSPSEPPPPIPVEFERRLELNLANAVEYLLKAETRANRREEIALMAASKLAVENKLTIAFGFIGKLDDPVDRENCYRLVAAIASQQGQGDEIWKQVARVGSPTEKVALCRGMITGLLATPPKAIPAAPKNSSASSKSE